MFRDRLLSASFLIAATALLFWLDHQHPLMGISGLWLLPLLMGFTIFTAIEAIRLIGRTGRSIDAVGAVLGAGLIAVSAYLPIAWPLTGEPYPEDCPIGRCGWIVITSGFAILGLLVRQMASYDPARRGEALERTLSGVFVSCYVGIPMATLVAIRDLGDGNWGLAALVSMIAVTKSADAGAYFSGKLLGRHKLIPKLSPGKTWEGAAGGVLFAIIVSFGCFFGLIPTLAKTEIAAPIWGPVVFGAVCAITGMIGDLAESLVKRETGAKDSGSTLPGLGGVWDVTDSLIATAIPAWVALASGLAGS